MKIPKKIKEMPWQADFIGNPRQHLRVTLSWPVVEGERLMVVTFSQNRDDEAKNNRSDVRLVCSKKLPAAAVLFRRDDRPKRRELHDVIGASLNWAYPEISEKEETALAKWLGYKPGESRNHFMPELATWVHKAIMAEKQRERDVRGEIRDEDVSLCPEELPEGIETFIRRHILPEDHVLIYKKGNVNGTCHACGKQVRIRPGGKRFTQNAVVECPACGTEVACFLNTSDRFKVDYVENIASMQKASDGATLFIRQWHIVRDHTAQYQDLRKSLVEIARYAIRGNRVAKWQREGKENCCMTSYRYDMQGWTRMQNTSEVYDGSYYFFCPENWRDLLQGTSLRYCNLDTYLVDPTETRRSRNVIRFLMDWAKYPMMEKLWKAGYSCLIHQRMAGLRKEQRNTILWHKNNLREGCRFPTRLLKIHAPEEWHMSDLEKVARLWEKVESGTIREKELVEIAESAADYEHIAEAIGHASIHKILKYVNAGVVAEIEGRKKAKAEAESKGAYYYMHSPLQTPGHYRDYLKDCIALRLDLDDRAVLFPADLMAAHQRTIAQVKYEKDAAKRELFSHTVQKLKWMEWEKNGLLIRLPESHEELKAEGAYLHHCVAGYADRMAEGKTVILLIRRAENPETPFFTLEWLGGQVQQCRTTGNQSYHHNEQVKAFVDAWVKKINRKGRQKAA